MRTGSSLFHFFSFSCLPNCLHRLLTPFLVLHTLFICATVWQSVYAHFLGGNLFVTYPREKHKIFTLSNFIIATTKFDSVSAVCWDYICLFVQQTNKNELNTSIARYNFARQTNIRQEFVNNDDFHDYVVNINFRRARAHGVEFLWSDDPQCSKYANISIPY